MPLNLRAHYLKLLISCGLTQLTFAQASSYTVTDLGTLGGSYSNAFGVNDSGEVVGTTMLSDGTTTAGFIYSNGVMTNIGTLGGALTQALAVNDAGQVVGSSAISVGGRQDAFLYSGGVMTDLGTLGGTTGGSQATAINVFGQVVGYSSATGGATHAFLYSGGVMSDLGTIPGGGSSYAMGINQSGQVTGYAVTLGGNGVNHPFIYSSGTMTDVGLPSGAYSGMGLGINNGSTVIGWGSNTGNGSYAFSALGGSNPTKLDTSGVFYEALAVNNLGQIVGAGNLGAYFGTTPLAPLVTNMDAAGFSSLLKATAISDSGYIVGVGETLTGSEEAFLLTPVPEPSTWALIALGLALVGFSFRRRLKQA